MKRTSIARREFLKGTSIAGAGLALPRLLEAKSPTPTKPNIIFVLADQWRAQDTGYGGNPEVMTPQLDKLAAESVNLTNAVSGFPVCCPYRGTLMTGQMPLTHGVFLNDLYLRETQNSIAHTYKKAGYDTAYVGKWHLDGHGSRSEYIPPKRRQGFEYFKALECTHNYNNSLFWANNDPVRKAWKGYDAIAQTRDAQAYIREHDKKKPFILFLAWGPPHAPYLTAPKEFQDMYKGKKLTLRPNVPPEKEKVAQRDIAGYYAHITALDTCMGSLVETIDQVGLRENTILVFTSDHGDMLYSQGQLKKQRPYDESIRVPFLLRHPARLGAKGKTLDAMINAQDIMPTLLSMSGVPIPDSVEGADFSGVIAGTGPAPREVSIISCASPFGQWTRRQGGKEYRGIRTKRYTYTRDLNGPWLLFDNQIDPYQQNNLVNKPEISKLQKKLDAALMQELKATKDEFLPGPDYIAKWGIKVDANGTVPYRG